MINVLLIDDELINIKVIEKFLRGIELNLICFDNAVDALDYINNTELTVDIILTDRMMPLMNGVEFTKQLRKNSKFINIPIIMLTAAADSRQIEEGLASGVTAYISKPFDQEHFLEVFRKYS